MVELFANSGDADQMLCSAVSDLGLHYLSGTCLGVGLQLSMGKNTQCGCTD